MKTYPMSKSCESESKLLLRRLSVKSERPSDHPVEQLARWKSATPPQDSYSVTIFICKHDYIWNLTRNHDSHQTLGIPYRLVEFIWISQLSHFSNFSHFLHFNTLCTSSLCLHFQLFTLFASFTLLVAKPYR